MDKKIVELDNSIEFAYGKNPDTPRVALYFNMSLNNLNTKPGVYSLMTRLFMQGTKNRTAQQLSEELDSYAIEFTSELKLDYIKFKFVCLNEDFEKALEIFTDIIKNTTFEDFDREVIKYEGEIIAELDSARAKVIDNYYKNIYEGHSYGYTNSVVLENLKNIKKSEITDAYEYILNNSKKVMTFVGDLDFDYVYNMVNKYLGDLPKSNITLPQLSLPKITHHKDIEVVKEDLNQAHILKGWLVDTANSTDYAPLALLNVILGASGLSSRLFLELRDKKGLAYVVRSSYDIARLVANFFIYIATEPRNIQTSLAGFEEEINKIKTIPVSNEELENAKNNLFGKWAFIGETNSQKANWLAHYGIMGFGFDFQEKITKQIKIVTPADIKNCANKYFNDKYVLTVLKP